MPSLPVPEGRRPKRTSFRARASLIINLNRGQKRLPCLVMDSSTEGFRLRGSFQLRRGQIVEIILDEDPLSAVRCSVVWVGKPGSAHEGEAGLQTV
jgi:PilZ domain